MHPPSADDPHVRPVDAQWHAHRRPLVAYVTSLLRDADAARDVVQEAFARLCEEKNARVPLPEWLYVVCRNLAIDRLRKGRKEQRMRLAEDAIDDEPRAADDPPLRLERADESRRLVSLLESLPARQREAVRLKFQQGLSYAQIAAVMETNPNNVAVLVHNGLKTLRGWMGEQGV